MNKQPTGVVSLKTTLTIEQQSADWLVRIDNSLDQGGMSKDEQAELKAWLAQDSLHADMLQQQSEIWSDMDVYANFLKKPEDVTRSPFLLYLFSMKPRMISMTLASVLVMVLSVWFVTFSDLYDPADVYATNIGSQRVERLSDGSRAHLNTDTEIKVSYTKNKRQIWLLKGEALFDVSHDPNRPFIVYAHGRAVKAIGTKFVVRLSSDKILVTVTEGKVQFSKKDSSDKSAAPSKSDGSGLLQQIVLIEQGQVAQVGVEFDAKPILSSVRESEIERQFAWVNGRLNFEDETLESIINEISRYTPVKVVIKDPEIKSYRLSGRFQVGSTEALLEAIELSQPQVSISRSAQTIYIDKKVK